MDSNNAQKSTPVNPPNPIEPHQKKNKTIILIISILIIIALVIGVAFLLKRYNRIFPQETPIHSIMPNQSSQSSQPDAQAKILEQSFQTGDMSKVFEFINKQLPSQNWLTDSENSTKIVFMEQQNNVSGSGRPIKQIVLKNQKVCQIINSQICKNYPDNQDYIFIGSTVLNQQPYSVTAQVVQQLRKIYNLKNSKFSCLDFATDVTTWTTKFWASLNDQQRGYLDGFGKELVDSENAKLKQYRNNDLANFIHYNLNEFQGICPATEESTSSARLKSS